MSSISLELVSIARRAYFAFIEPLISRDFAALHGHYTVIITSSVAYGLADKLSDLDVFILIDFEGIYALHGARLAEAIQGIAFPPEWADVCDKGVRFEIESLDRAELGGVYRCAPNEVLWVNQTEWLLYWAVNSIIIDDPSDIMLRLKQRIVEGAARHQSARLCSLERQMAWLYSEFLRDHSPGNQMSLAGRLISLALDRLFVSGGGFPPHLKWKETLARREEGGAELIAGIESFFGSPNFKDALGEVISVQAQSAAPREVPIRLCTQLRFSNAQDATYDAYLRESKRSPKFQTVQDALLREASAYRLCLRYYYFLVWRKLRVVSKAGERGQTFTSWYFAIQVMQHFKELDQIASGILRTEFSDLAGLDDFEELLRADRFSKNVEVLVSRAWEIHRAVGRILSGEDVLSEEEVDWPLSYQFEIQYWRYELTFW